MDRLQAMHVFTAVVDAGSFVKAADTLGMSKAAVSRAVSDLEARLGVRLLHRTTRRLAVTDEGRTFHARSKTLLADVDEAEAEISSRTGQARGLLKVNVPVTFGLLHLASLWPQFMVRHPQVALDVTLSDRIVDLVDEGYDVAIRIARLASSTLISRKLATTRMILCASPGYLRAHGAPAHPHELPGHAVLAYSLFALGDRWPFEGPDGPVSIEVSPRMRTNSGDTCRAAALADCGIVLQPSFLVGDDVRAGRLVEILTGFRSLELGVYAVYPTREHVSPKVRVFIDFLVHAFATPSWQD